MYTATFLKLPRKLSQTIYFPLTHGNSWLVRTVTRDVLTVFSIAPSDRLLSATAVDFTWAIGQIKGRSRLCSAVCLVEAEPTFKAPGLVIV